MRGRNGRVTQRCHNSPYWKRGYGVRVTSRTGRARRILGDFEKVSWDETCLGGRRLVFACSRRLLWRVAHVLGGGRRKSQNRKNVPLSPYVEEPLNSKVIKSFVPEQRSRYVFFVFRDSYVLCIYVINVPCTFRIFMYMAMLQREQTCRLQWYVEIDAANVVTHFWTL